MTLFIHSVLYLALTACGFTHHAFSSPLKLAKISGELGGLDLDASAYPRALGAGEAPPVVLAAGRWFLVSALSDTGGGGQWWKEASDLQCGNLVSVLVLPQGLPLALSRLGVFLHKLSFSVQACCSGLIEMKQLKSLCPSR